jgi:hypothetical protein
VTLDHRNATGSARAKWGKKGGFPWPERLFQRMTRDQILLIYWMGVLCAVVLAGIRALRLRAGRESATVWCHG